MSTLQGPVRYSALHAAPPHERAAAQSLVTMNSSIGSIATAAAMGAIIAEYQGQSQAERVHGYSVAYLATAGCLVLALFVASFLPAKAKPAEVKEVIEDEPAEDYAV
jgi:MFS family permease